MTQKIIYPTKNGVAVIHPTGEISFEDVCKKDVPAKTPYLIVHASEIPTDRTFRSAWESDFSNPHGFGIGPQAWFIEQYLKEIEKINTEHFPIKTEDMTDDEFFAVVGMWEQSKIARIDQLNKKIEVQEKEMQA